MKSRRKRIEEILEHKFKIRVNIGDSQFFIERRGKGFVLGPRKPLNGAKNDHLTIGISKQEEFQQIHRKTDDIEKWRHTEESIKSAVSAFIDSHKEQLNPSELSRQGVYIISWARANALFSLFLLVVQIPIRLLGPSVLKYNIVELNENKFVIRFGVDKRRAEYYARRIAYPLVRLLTLFGKMPQKSVMNIMMTVGRLLLVKVDRDGKPQTDFGLLISQERIGLVWKSEDGRLSFLSLQALNEARQIFEDNLPFGNVSAFFNLTESFGEITIEKQ